MSERKGKVHHPDCLHREPGVTVCTCSAAGRTLVRMSDIDPTPADADYELVDRLFTLHPPQSDRANEVMDDLRHRYITLANAIVRQVPRTPDRTIALRDLHRACMNTIASVACNQELL